jgi:hypothetical protein
MRKASLMLRADAMHTLYSPFMFTPAQYHNTLASIEAEIADAELRLAEDLESLTRGREAGAATYELETQVRNCRFALENLWSVRQQHLRAEVARWAGANRSSAKPSRGEVAARFVLWRLRREQRMIMLFGDSDDHGLK